MVDPHLQLDWNPLLRELQHLNTEAQAIRAAILLNYLKKEQTITQARIKGKTVNLNEMRANPQLKLHSKQQAFAHQLEQSQIRLKFLSTIEAKLTALPALSPSGANKPADNYNPYLSDLQQKIQTAEDLLKGAWEAASKSRFVETMKQSQALHTAETQKWQALYKRKHIGKMLPYQALAWFQSWPELTGSALGDSFELNAMEAEVTLYGQNLSELKKIRADYLRLREIYLAKLPVDPNSSFSHAPNTSSALQASPKP